MSRGQRGQAMVLAAILMTVLVGFVGLAIDGGELQSAGQLAHNAADGAALAAAYGIAVQGDTEAAATTQGGDVLTADGLPTSDLALSYLDSSGNPTATASSVAKVVATVTNSESSFFLGAVGVPTLRSVASATASTTITSGGSTGTTGFTLCAICLMKSSGQILSTGSGATLNLSGPLIVNSGSSPAAHLGNNSVVTATATTFATGGTATFGPGARFTPAITNAPAIADPFSTLTAPSVSGAATAYTAPAGTPSISPGIYSSITVPSGSALTMTAGSYVVTGGFNITGGSVTGSGVMVYLACPSYPTACSSGGSGGFFNVNTGSITLSPPTSGTYTGFVAFADRNDSSASTLGNANVNFTGTWYAMSMPFNDAHASDHETFGQLVLATLTLANNDVFTFNGASVSTNGVVGLTV